jgi:flavin reductase
MIMASSLSHPALRERFLGGMSLAAHTVSVVATDGPAGRLGVTVSAMSSVSADAPDPMLLVCIHERSPAARAVVDNGVFSVNVLRDDQAGISDCFAGRTGLAGADRFAGAEWIDGATGAPHLADRLVAFDCRVASHQLVGTHYVIFGAVEDIAIAEAGAPLIHVNRSYGTPAPLAARG